MVASLVLLVREGLEAVFYQCCDEVADLDFTQAFLYILDLFKQTLRENLFLSESMVSQILTTFMAKFAQIYKEPVMLSCSIKYWIR